MVDASGDDYASSLVREVPDRTSGEMKGLLAKWSVHMI